MCPPLTQWIHKIVLTSRCIIHVHTCVSTRQHSCLAGLCRWTTWKYHVSWYCFLPTIFLCTSLSCVIRNNNHSKPNIDVPGLIVSVRSSNTTLQLIHHQIGNSLPNTCCYKPLDVHFITVSPSMTILNPNVTPGFYRLTAGPGEPLRSWIMWLWTTDT